MKASLNAAPPSKVLPTYLGEFELQRYKLGVVVQFDVEAALRRHMAGSTRRYIIKLHHYQIRTVRVLAIMCKKTKRLAMTGDEESHPYLIDRKGTCFVFAEIARKMRFTMMY